MVGVTLAAAAGPDPAVTASPAHSAPEQRASVATPRTNLAPAAMQPALATEQCVSRRITSGSSSGLEQRFDESKPPVDLTTPLPPLLRVVPPLCGVPHFAG